VTGSAGNGQTQSSGIRPNRGKGGNGHDTAAARRDQVLELGLTGELWHDPDLEA
jgi:hypothetical protein